LSNIYFTILPFSAGGPRRIDRRFTYWSPELERSAETRRSADALIEYSCPCQFTLHHATDSDSRQSRVCAEIIACVGGVTLSEDQ